MIPRLIEFSNDTSEECMEYVSQLELVVNLTKEFINLIEQNDYIPTCNCPHCQAVNNLIEKINKKIED